MLKKSVIVKNISLTLMGLLLMLVTHLHAAVVDDLYSVELPVADQTTTQRLQVFNQAFREVIVKISGSEEALKLPGFKRPLTNSSRYVLQFRYINRNDNTDVTIEAGQLYLKVTFNQDLVEKLLRENDVPIWGKQRPSTLLLISYDISKNLALVSGDTTPELIEDLDALAIRKGLPVLFPLLDLEDRVILGVEDVVRLNETNIQALSARYAPDAVLVGQIEGRVGKGWKGNWQVRFADRLLNWSYQGRTRENVLNQAIGRLASTLATEYALQTFASNDEDVLLRIDEVDELTDHTRILSYLKSLDAVKSVRLVLIEEELVTYRVSLLNSVEDMQRLISLGNLLEQLDLPQVNAASDDPTVMMNYRLMR